MKKQKNKKIVLIYDDLVQKGGGEKLFLYLCSLFPSAKIIVPIINKHYLKLLKLRKLSHSRSLSFLSHVPFFGYTLASLLSFFYFERLKFDNIDLVIALSNRFSHMVVTRGDTKLVSIVTTPFRALFKSNYNYIFSNIVMFLRIVLQVGYKRSDKILAISSVCKKRLKKLGINSQILNPPLLCTDEFKEVKIPFSKNSYFLMVGRINKNKVNYFDTTLKFLRDKELNIVVVGSGNKLPYLKSRYKNFKNIYFTGFLPDAELNFLYKNAKALIHPQIEDYGLIPLEAMHNNCAVICKNKGGVLDYLNNKNAYLYNSKKDLLSFIEIVNSKKQTKSKTEIDNVLDIASSKKFEYNLMKLLNNL